MVEEPLRITLPDGSLREVAAGTTVAEVLTAWRPKESSTFLAASLDGEPVDLARRVERSAKLVGLTFEDRAGREVLQHSAAHLVAKALTEWISEARPTVGPPTEEGFYYDFEVRPLTPEDIAEVEKRIARDAAARLPFARHETDRDDALERFRANPHKQRYIRDAPEGETVSYYTTGEFVDLCRGPHVPDSGWLAGVKILGFSAVTLGGTPDGLPLQRVRGVGFPTRAQLELYLKHREQAEARDHRTLGARLGLFHFVESAPGFPVWLPKGMIVVRELEKFIRTHLEASGYSEVRTPLLFAQSVYETSGHWDLYRENMFLSEVDGRAFGWKPMNCPGAMLLFGSRARSYRELPLRLAEFATLHRLEASGTLHGLTRVRELVQDDAHLFVTEEQVDPELRKLLDWVAEAYTAFHLTWSYELSTRPSKFLGDPAVWDRAEGILRRTLESANVPYRIGGGEGAFYAPKIDIHIRDSLGRPWQTGTIQLDYQMPSRFGLEYQGPDGLLHTPVVIHRTILGTFERFIGVLLEHVNGRLPPWLAPVQIRILPVADRHETAALGLRDELGQVGLRAEVSEGSDTLSKRVRESELERIPYIAVLGDTEVAQGTVALRVRGEKGQRSLSRPELLHHLQEKVHLRSFEA